MLSLSHTWEEEEVSQQELWVGSEETRSKVGYLKIQCACEIAQWTNIRYMRIDTCCIDKKSSAELSEAINSMFRWYRNARVCHVHLSDVAATEVVGHTYGSEQFIASQWFTRGWTLQEVIVPERLLFFNSQWQHIGSVDDFLSGIVKATTIDHVSVSYTHLTLPTKRIV